MANKFNGTLNVRDYGAARYLPLGAFRTTAIAASAILTAEGVNWASSDTGKAIAVLGANTAGATLWTTISSVPNNTVVLTSVDATTGVYHGTITGGAANAFAGLAFS